MTEEAKARTTTFLICMFEIVIELRETVVVVLSRSMESFFYQIEEHIAGRRGLYKIYQSP